MVIELYLFRFIIYCLVAFLLGYLTIYTTLKSEQKGLNFEFFYVFKKIGLPDLLESVWKVVVSFVEMLTGIKLEVIKPKK